MLATLPVINLSEAKFECVFGRGCDGICCKDGRPLIRPDDAERIASVLDRALAEMRPEARKLVEEQGYLSKRLKGGHPMARVSEGWCVFFNQGCVLHKLGMEDGDWSRYKPLVCVVFPLEIDPEDGTWYVRQKGFHNEDWDLFCLDPQATTVPAAESLTVEMGFIDRLRKEDLL
jgi:hypothetical protein